MPVDPQAPTDLISVQKDTPRAAIPYSGSSLASMLGWSYLVDEREYVPDLVWPHSIKVFDQMRTDSQMASLFHAMLMRIRRFKWGIDPNGADPKMVQKISRDYNLPVKGETEHFRGRLKNRFSFKQHQFEAFLALFYGHSVFEQYGEIGLDNMWHVRKLSVVPQYTIQNWGVAEDGGLIAIQQTIRSQTSGRLFGFTARPIPIDRLVVYPWDKEGPNWVGRSMMRDCYKNWVAKDRLLRIDVINHEHAGGVPWIEAPMGATPAEREAMAVMAQQFKVGEMSGGSVPAGGSLNLAKVGAGTDVINSIRYHDEAMSRRFLMMFIQLGQTQTGSRALGESFMDAARDAQDAIADWFADIFNEHVIEDDIDWNYGTDVEQVPRLTWWTENEDEDLPLQDLATLVRERLIVVDDELEDYLRHRYDLPQKGTPRPAPQPVEIGESEPVAASGLPPSGRRAILPKMFRRSAS
jgi:hypothetical protein